MRVAPIAVAILLGGGAIALGAHRSRGAARCPEGMESVRARCCGIDQFHDDGRCAGEPARCGAEQDHGPGGCVARARRVAVEAGRLTLDFSDWEAVGAELPALGPVAAFEIDAFEVTEARWAECHAAGACPSRAGPLEPGLPVTSVTADEAEAFCRFAGGALPTKEQLAFAAAGPEGRRYPWGSVGAVCRRAAYGLVEGPCASGGRTPELAGSRPDGATPTGIHDLAGNVAEWAGPAGAPTARGGSFRDGGASALRTWNGRRERAGSRHDDVGFRCVYPG